MAQPSSNTNMVAGQNLDPLTSSPEMLQTPQNTPAWVKAWLRNLHLNSAEKTDEEIGDCLISKHYTTRASLKYGILATPDALAKEFGISEVLAGQLCDEATFISQRTAVSLPAFTPYPAANVVSPMKPQKPWTVFSGKFTVSSHELRISKDQLDTVMTNLLFHANSQSVTAGLPITRFLENPALIHDAASLAAFEAHVDPHDNAQLATILMSALPASICNLLRLAHGTTGTGTKIISGFTILQYLYKPHVGVYAATYNHQKDTAAVTQPKIIAQCLEDLDACLLIWRAALARLTAANLAPNELMLIEGLHKLMSKRSPEFKSMLKQVEYMDKVSGKAEWTHTDLLKHLDRQAAESMQHPRPADVTALFAAVDTQEVDQVGYVAKQGTGKESTCYGWMLDTCVEPECPKGFAHPPADKGNRTKIQQIRCYNLLTWGKCTREACPFNHGPKALKAQGTGT